jgi:hypothetical protein
VVSDTNQAGFVKMVGEVETLKVTRARLTEIKVLVLSILCMNLGERRLIYVYMGGLFDAYKMHP